MAQTLNTPQVLNQPIANNGDKNVIPNTNDVSTGNMSISAGFPPVTSQRIADGGIPPKRADFNGAFNLLSQQNYFLQNGGTFTFRQDVSNAIGGYPEGAILWAIKDEKPVLVKSLIPNNTNNFVTNPEYLDDINWQVLAFGAGGGLEIGDIGIAPLGIDETKNLRRYLNGQVISQTQFVAFTNLIKKRILTNPSLATTEENWQSEVSLSKLGQCGKFVIDDALGTIRLPKVVNINGLQDLSLMGSIKAESLPNITGEFPDNGLSWGMANNAKGAFNFKQIGNLQSNNGSAGDGGLLDFDASRVSSTYQDNAPVQQEAVQYPYFIQVATGSEEEVNITNEIQLNNPFSLLDYKWSEYELTNASWLISNGSFHSGATYPAVYDLLLRIYNGTETKEGVSVKLSTEVYEDTDFVLNTADSTFRLPVKVANTPMGGSAPVEFIYTQQNGETGTAVLSTGVSGDYGLNHAVYVDKVGGAAVSARTSVTAKSTLSEATNDNLKLYFYVGETIQDANVISASQVLTEIANLKGYDYVVESYGPDEDGDWYRVYKNGWVEQGGRILAQNAGNISVNLLKEMANTDYNIIGSITTLNSQTTVMNVPREYSMENGERTTTTFQTYILPSQFYSFKTWEAKGQGA